MLGAGGSDGGTDWVGMSIEMMRALVQNPNIEAHYELLTGWRRSYELVSDQMMQVQSYRDNLAAVWPPDKSAASSIYLSHLDEMIANLNETYEAALANHDAFASATLSISLAQHDFEKIWHEHEANKSKLAEYQNDVAMSSAATFDTTPPVTAMQQEAVRRKAITLMSSVSSDLAQAQVRIVRPTPYQPPTPIDDKTETFTGTTTTAPPIPPITPSFAESSSTRRAVDIPAGEGKAIPGGAQFTAQPVAGGHQPGPVLGGTGPQVVAPVPSAVVPAVPTLPVDSSGPSDISPLTPRPNTSLPGMGRSSSLPDRIRPGRDVPADGLISPSTDSREHLRASSGSSGGLRAMPPGGLIGGTVGEGLGQPGATRPGFHRVNPVGGMIGEGEPGYRSNGKTVTPHGSEGMIAGGFGSASERAGGLSARSASATERTIGHSSSSAQHYGQPASRKAGSTGQPKSLRWDPESPWETAEGVDPVVQPPKEQQVDPGPVIGLR